MHEWKVITHSVGKCLNDSHVPCLAEVTFVLSLLLIH